MATLLAACTFTSCSPQTNDKRTAQFDSLFTGLAKRGMFNGNVLIADKGQVIYQASFGKADRRTGRVLDSASVFELASVSKQFTAAGILLLVEKGRISLEDTLRKFIPELPYYGITIRQLLHHTSGLPDYIELFDRKGDRTKIATNEDMIRLLAREKPSVLFAPGSKWAYSNTGYAVLGSIIEKVSGKTYASFMEEEIFRPLDMRNTKVISRRMEKKLPVNYAYGYIYDGVARDYTLPDSAVATGWMVYMLDGIQGDGTVNSTVGDLLKWDRALRSSSLLKTASIEQAFTPGKLADGSETHYGFGWGILSTKDFGKIVNHGGSWPGYSSFIERHLEKDKTVIILQNIDPPLPEMQPIRKILYRIPDEQLKEQAVTAAELNEYTGTYRLTPDFSIVIRVNKDQLYAQATAQGSYPVFRQEKDLFFYKVVEAKLRFERDAQNRIIALILLQDGQELRGEKIK